MVPVSVRTAIQTVPAGMPVLVVGSADTGDGHRRRRPQKAAQPTTRAMAAGVARYPWSATQVAALLD